ncbi:hypothetical protein HDK90DRAFT_528715 [Phyllosticta capitalensis]|uniref:Myb-like domain-containing protein n=1 Tax=Phyllosticta capitalensis TaxID=121624 RepID=A0ABR1YC19_9PEZI
MVGDEDPRSPSRLGLEKLEIEERPQLIKISDTDVDGAQHVALFGKYPPYMGRRKIRKSTSTFPVFGLNAPDLQGSTATHELSPSQPPNGAISSPEPAVEAVADPHPTEASDLQHEAKLATCEDHCPSTPQHDSAGRLESDNSNLKGKEKEFNESVDHETNDDQNHNNLTVASAHASSIETQMDTNTKMANAASQNKRRPARVTKASKPKKTTRGWSKDQEGALAESVRYVVEHGGHDEDVLEMWEIIGERVRKVHNVDKSGTACRMWYCRKLRARIGFDERKTAKPENLVTCAQKPAAGSKRSRQEAEDGTDEEDGDGDDNDEEDGDEGEEDDDYEPA